MKRIVKRRSYIIGTMAAALALLMSASLLFSVTYAEDDKDGAEEAKKTGGGYAVTDQLEGVGYSAKLYNATNGLPTSDANTILATDDGYIWIGGYAGLVRYDGSSFERLDSSGGLTNAKSLFEDSKGRLWVGTNDNGVVVMDKGELIQFTYEDGLPSSTIRGFGEDLMGNVFIGTTNGVAYVDEGLNYHNLDESQLNGQYIIRMCCDDVGRIYGNTRNGDAFLIEDMKITGFYHGEDIGVGHISDVYADPEDPGTVYLASDNDKIYKGSFDDNLKNLKEINADPLSGEMNICRAAGRIWLITDKMIGYLDENEKIHPLENIPFDSGIENMTEDYQGNLWFTSSRQGVLEIVTSNFKDLTEYAHLPEQVVNATCLFNGDLYIGTDNGLQILDKDFNRIENDLSDYIGDTRIRCLLADDKGYLWVATYTNNLGVVRYKPGEEIVSFNEENGFLNDGARCLRLTSDGKVLVGTNGGLAIFKDGKPERSVGAESGINNTVFLTVEEGDNGKILAGSDGDGIYVIDGNNVTRLGREDGLTSDVILRIKKDDERGVYWIVTSNSIEYMKQGEIVKVENFPYSNNYDMYFDDNGGAWILSSFGIYNVDADDLIEDGEFEYRLYNTADGLPSVPTGNAYSAQDDEGHLYVSGREGVSRVNIDNFFDQSGEIKTDIKAVYASDEQIFPDATGKYVIPATTGRIQFKAAILNYKLSNPLVKIFLEGANDSGITMNQNNLTALEYTDLAYGDYILHIQILDNDGEKVLQDNTFRIKKQPRFFELIVIKIILIALGMAVVGLIVWRVMTGTIIRRQYEQIRAAKEEADRASTAKSRFLANMSHEIRTPINTIMGMDEMILREDPTDVPKPYFMSITNYALDIRHASESLLSLINDVLDMSKIESGKMNVVEQEYDTGDLLRSVISMIRVRGNQKDLTFDTDIDSELPVRLYGDVGKIKQILLNLLTNAVKYTEEGGYTLKASVVDKDDERATVRFSVKDTGIGIKPEDMEKLFAAFERLEEDRNFEIQGTGLGLDISRQFAELMGGELKCESTYGEGSEFILTLTQRIIDGSVMGEFDEHAGEEEKGPYVPQFCAPDAEILVVDDNPMNLTVIKGLLSATKMFITTAASGEECLEKLKYGSFNIVLLDHMMPGMDGIETVQKIREKWPDLPVFALTANATAGGEEFYVSKGFTGYLEKPVNSMLLEKSILKYLPPEIVMKTAKGDEKGVPMTLPEDKKWLEEVEGISVSEGIKHSGGVDPFLYSLNMFYDTIDDNSSTIKNAYNENDINLYTIKVHALKSSARIIGAAELSELSRKLEDAGKAEDKAFIDAHTEELLSMYAAYKEKLAGLKEKEEEKTDEPEKEPVSEEELNEAYEALKELIPMMDYDGVEMVVNQLKNYKLSEEDSAKMKEIEKRLKRFDWDGLEKLI